MTLKTQSIEGLYEETSILADVWFVAQRTPVCCHRSVHDFLLFKLLMTGIITKCRNCHPKEMRAIAGMRIVADSALTRAGRRVDNVAAEVLFFMAGKAQLGKVKRES